MPERLVIHPLNRGVRPIKIILKVEGGAISGAEVGATHHWDFSKVLMGKDPMDGIQLTQRMSGIDFTAHALAAAKALEGIAQSKLTNNARIIRNIALGLDIIYGHITHYYQSILPDYIPFPSAGILSNTRGDYRLPPNRVESMLKNAWRAFEVRRMIHSILAIFGGKAPHVCNIIFGGVTRIATGFEIIQAQSMLKEITGFINNEYAYDLWNIKKVYSEYFNVGTGVQRLLSVGEFPQKEKAEHMITAKALINSQSVSIDKSLFGVDVTGSWFEPELEGDDENSLGTRFKAIPGKSGGYSWVKGALYDKQTCETGAMPRMYLSGNQNITDLGAGAFSVMGRLRARLEEGVRLAEQIAVWLEQLNPSEKPDINGELPETGEGVGLAESSGGAVVHYVSLRGGKISNYNILDSCSWNARATSQQGQRGPIEQALVGIPVSGSDIPVQAYRVARSF